MSTHSRNTKANGTTEWANGDQVLASEHNDEWNDFLNDYNGNITNANISGSAAIAVSKIATISLDDLDDHSANDAEFLGVGAALGDSFSVSNLPTDGSDEIEALRRRIKFNAGGTNLKGKDDSAVSALGWIEPPCIGPNLLTNPGFEDQATSGTDTPTGWTLDGTPTVTMTAQDSDAFGTSKRSISIAGTSEGLEQTVSGLKASTKYRLIVLYKRVDGTVNFSTTGALGTGDYQNFSEDITTGTSVSILQAVVKTDSSGSDVTVHLGVENAGSDEVQVYYVSFREMADDAPLELPSIPVKVAVDDTQQTGFPTQTPATTNALEWEARDELALSQYIPYQGYRMTYTVTINYQEENSGSTDSMQYGFRLKLNGTVVDGPYIEANYDAGTVDDQRQIARTVTLTHTVDNPAPGTNHAFTVEGAWRDSSGFTKMTLNPTSTDGDTVQSVSRARLIVDKL